MAHEIVRARHELRRRALTVHRKENVTPGMLRIWLRGEDLEGFTSLGADDHVKIFVGGTDGSEPERRDYTPRRYDAEAGELAIDFALHEAGPATRWAIDAAPGDVLNLGGPRGSMVVPFDFDWWLLIGDETALPAIGRRLEEMPEGTPVTSLVSVSGPAEQQDFETDAQLQALWVHRSLDRASDPRPLLDVLKSLTLPEGDGFVWIAAEASVARALRAHILEERGHTPQWFKASGYWIEGQADATEKF